VKVVGVEVAGGRSPEATKGTECPLSAGNPCGVLGALDGTLQFRHADGFDERECRIEVVRGSVGALDDLLLTRYESAQRRPDAFAVGVSVVVGRHGRCGCGFR
jgi:hypothetical protein